MFLRKQVNNLNGSQATLHLNDVTIYPPLIRPKVPTVITVHHLQNKSYFFKKTLSLSRKIITPSKFTKNQLLEYDKRLSNKISVIYNGISEEFQPQKTEEKNTIVFPNALRDDRKGLMWLLPLLGKLQKRFDFILIFTGKLSTNIHWLENIKKELKKHKIKYKHLNLDSIHKLSELYASAKVVLTPSRLEGFNMVPFEVTASGGICLASRTADLDKIFKNIESCKILPLDLKVWESELMRILEDSDKRCYLKRRSLGKHSREIRKTFTWERTVEKLIKVYELLEEY